MSAEQLIALEAALAELSSLYTVAKGFAALQRRAESELLPRVSTLGARLRGLLRTAQLTDDAIDVAAREILALGWQWRVELEHLRASAAYQRALQAWAADRQDELARVIPGIFAGMPLVSRLAAVYFPVSPSVHRRRPGASPFLSAADCAERIIETLQEGIVPEAGGTEWWERELRFISCADAADALETPIALRVDAVEARVAIFAAPEEAALRIFTPRLRAPMSVVLAAEATDEWWQAYQDSYRSFRDSLQQELAARGRGAAIAH